MKLDPDKIARARADHDNVVVLFERLEAENTAADNTAPAEQPNRYAVIQTHARRRGGCRAAYTVGRVVTIDLTDYVFPISDGHCWHVSFGNKRAAFAYAGSLGPVIPGIHVQDHTRPEGFAFKPAPAVAD